MPYEATNFSIITSDHDGERRVLLVCEDGAWTLPHHHHVRAADINRELGGRLGLDLITLECVKEFSNGRPIEGSRIFVQENRGRLPSHSGTRWANAIEMAQIELRFPEHRDVITKWLDNARSEHAGVNRFPWARPGWLAEASAWACDQAEAAGRSPLGPVEQLDVRPWSALLTVQTDKGRLYFKASMPATRCEPELTRTVGEWFPGNVPEVIATEPNRRWMLMSDFGPTAEYGLAAERVDLLTAVFPTYVRIQCTSIDRIGELRRLGCPYRPIELLPSLFEDLLDRKDLLSIGEGAGLSDTEYSRLVALVPAFRATCEELATFNLPTTLVHNDIFSENLKLVDGEPFIYDWADGSVGHPFFDMEIVKHEIATTAPGDCGYQARVRDVYLACWSDFGPYERLLRAFELADAPGIVNRAVMWRDSIADVDEDQRLGDKYKVATYLRKLLRHM